MAISEPVTEPSATPGSGANDLDARAAAAVLTETRRRVEPELRAAVAALPEPIREICDYHFGWIDPPTPSRASNGVDGSGGAGQMTGRGQTADRGQTAGRGQTADRGQMAGRGQAAGRGKAVRPALVLACAQAVGGEVTSALPAAVAVELIHNFSLLHDDVLDRDATRRGRPTAWTVFGAGPAILAGDALLARAFDVLAATEHPRRGHAIRWLAATVAELTAGQYADLSFEQRDDVDFGQCVAMARDKTAALLGCCCALGALFADGTDERIEALRRFGEVLGLAFQHVDDLLGIWGDPARTGKPAYSDLRCTKKSLPVVAALSGDSAAAGQLRAHYRADQLGTETDFAHIARLIEEAGGRAHSQTQVEHLLDGALEHVRHADPSVEAAATLRALALLITHRDT